MEVICYGKVLVTGGYLILWEQYRGLVVSCSAKMKSSIEITPGTGKLEIVSERFNGRWKFDMQEYREIEPCENKFVKESVRTALDVLRQVVGEERLRERNIEMKIVGDEEFYLSSKTGLGSSACVICCIVLSLFEAFGVEDVGLRHLTSQIANARAQQKIGSGFDISACIFGSHIFKRKKLPFEDVESMNTLDINILTQHSPLWSNSTPYSLPSCYQLILIEGEGSTDTRTFVRNLLAWVSSHESAKETLQQLNSTFEQIQANIEQQDDTSIKEHAKTMRRLQREISEDAGVDILPEDTYSLLEEISTRIDSVVLAGVPGAGGRDAFYILIREDSHEQASEILLTSFPQLKILNVKAR